MNGPDEIIVNPQTYKKIQKYMAIIGKKGGSVKSVAKTRANRLNGKKPKKKRIKPEVKS